MYETFYGLKEKPFALLPDPEFLYLGKRHSDALALLEYGLFNRAGIILISGEIGCGKTTLVRQLLSTKADEIKVGIINNTHQDFGELLKWVALAFGLDYRGKEKVELYDDFMRFLEDLHQNNQKATLIIDEAQNMDTAALEQLRMLSNINVDKQQVLQLILIGQPELREKLLQPELKQLVQRIAIDYYLEPLEPKEVFHYIRHRMKVAGGDPETFGIEATIAVYKYSGGIPRLINILCDTALVYGYAQNKEHIDQAIIEEVVFDKKKGSILPIHGFSTMETEEIPEFQHVSIGS
ncbi:MAG: ExeA family protein [bacterium]